MYVYLIYMTRIATNMALLKYDKTMLDPDNICLNLLLYMQQFSIYAQSPEGAKRLRPNVFNMSYCPSVHVLTSIVSVANALYCC